MGELRGEILGVELGVGRCRLEERTRGGKARKELGVACCRATD